MARHNPSTLLTACLFVFAGYVVFAIGPASATTDETNIVLPPQTEAGLTKLTDPRAFFIESAFAPEIKALNDAQRKAAMARLKTALDSEHLEVRRRAALVLGELGDNSGVPVIIKDYTNAKERATNDNDRDNLAVALRVLKDQRAVPALTAALDDPFPHVRLIALDALGELGAGEAYDKIAAHLKDKERSPKDGDIVMYPAASACYALGRLGDRRAIPLLIAALDDSDLVWDARHALAAITKTGETWNAQEWKRWWAESGERQAAAQPALRVRIAVPEGRAVVVRDDHAHFDVVIENVSDTPQTIIDEWNSDGYFNLRFEYTTADGIKKVMEKLGRDWGKNFLTTTTLKPGEVLVRAVVLDPSIWSESPVPGRGETTVTIRAVFAQQDSPDAWRGKVISAEAQVTFRNLRP